MSKGCSPELRPYDPRPAGAPLLPFKDRDAEFYAQRKRSAPARDWAALDELDPDSAAAERFPRGSWRYFDPRDKPRFARWVVVCDPNKRETEDGAFASIGAWGLDRVVVPAAKPGEPKPEPPVHPWYMHRLREARGRWAYSGLVKQLVDMLDVFPEAKDLVFEHSAAGDTLAGDHEFLARVTRKGVTAWVAEPNGGFARLKREGSRWVAEKVGDPAALAGAKEERWDRCEKPLEAGHFLLPAREHGRVTTDWVADREDGKEEADRQGWVTEWARAHPDGVVDRVDEGAILCAWSLTCAGPVTSWRYAAPGAGGR